MALKTMKVKITGLSGLMVHNGDILADPLHPMCKELKAISGKKSKTDEDHIALSQLEWKGGLYFDEEIGPYLPSRMIKKGLINGAMKFKAGPKMKGGVIVNDAHIPLEYDGPRDLKGLWDDGRFILRLPVVVSGQRVMRSRPYFPEWGCTVSLTYDDEVMDKADILRAGELAGQLFGFGDYRVAKGGEYGRFEVAGVK